MMPQPQDAGLPGLIVSSDGGLVGRHKEIARVNDAVAAVCAHRGGSVWIEGEPGIGKSAIVAAGLARAHQAGCRVFAARADETATRFPLRVLLDALQVGPRSADAGRAEIAALLWGTVSVGAVTSGDAVAAAAERLLMLVDRLCASGAVVIAADDLQW